MQLSDFPPQWLLMYFAVGWLLGLLAVRDGKWAALCGLSTTLAVVFGFRGQALPFFGPWPLLGLSFLGVLALWGVSRLPALPKWKPVYIGVAALMTPLVAWTAMNAGAMWFIVIFQIP